LRGADLSNLVHSRAAATSVPAMARSTRPGLLAAGIAVAGLLTVPVTAAAARQDAAAAAAKKAPKPIGYIYAGSIFGGIYTLAVEPGDAVKVVKDTPSPNGDIGGVALLHTKSGLHLYVVAGPFGREGEIYQYSVDRKTGAIAPTKIPPVTGALPTFSGNNLFAYDGYATDPSYASVIYVQACDDPSCSTYGLVALRANPATGALHEFGPRASSFMHSISVDGDRMAILQSPQSGPGLVLSSLRIDHTSGGLIPVGAPFHLVDKEKDPLGGQDVAAGDTPGIDGLNVKGVGSVGVDTGSILSVTSEDYTGSALRFIPHALLDAEYGPTFGPWLQLVSPDGAGSDGHIDLTQKPYSLQGGSDQDPYFTETIYQLGTGIYLGNYLNPIVEATDGVGGKGLVIDSSRPTVAGTISVNSMSGFLEPTATKTTIIVTRSGVHLHVKGSVKAGVAGLSVSVTLAVRKAGKYSPVQHKNATLSKSAHYAVALSTPKASTCRATATYQGNAATSASKASLTFSC
jgi:hypothetical protein